MSENLIFSDEEVYELDSFGIMANLIVPSDEVPTIETSDTYFILDKGKDSFISNGENYYIINDDEKLEISKNLYEVIGEILERTKSQTNS